MVDHDLDAEVDSLGLSTSPMRRTRLRSDGRMVGLKRLTVPITDGVPISVIRKIGRLKYDRRLISVYHGPRTETEQVLYLVLNIDE